MVRTPIRSARQLAFALAIVLLAAGSASAQLSDILSGGPLGQSAAGIGGPTEDNIVKLDAHFTVAEGGRIGMLSVTATIAPPWYTYSTTQPPRGALPTVIEVTESDAFRLTGDFRSTLPPKVIHDAGMTLEEFAGSVTWQAPIELASGANLDQVVISGEARLQVCKVGTCLPPAEYAFTAGRRVEEKAAAIVEFTHPQSHVTLRGYLEPRTATPGSTVNLVLTADPAPDWHIYALAAADEGGLGNKPTVIGFSNTSGFQIKATSASEPPVEGESPIPGLPPTAYHETPVKWTTPIVIPADAKPGSYPIEGYIGYQTCLADRCDLPRGAKFSGELAVGPTVVPGAAAISFTDAKYGEAAQAAAAQPRPIDKATAEFAATPIGWSLPIVILAGLAGGFILNFMPCVLPVIGLKILSFAEQAGRSRAQIFSLNIWYALGTLTVFMVLATLATGVSWGLSESNLGWGEQFSSTWFNVVMVAIVFSMALSFLGVWEIPIPGFVGSGKANDLAAREGYGGAFAKGIMATILATPCSGPALGPVFGYTLNQPPYITYLLFACIALGMSAPYLAIGMFPRLIRFLPKPGAWMDTFKQLMGFVLLGTVVFLFSFMDRDYLVPTFAMMVGIWAACWWIGRTSLTESLGRKLLAWGQGTAFAAVVGICAFSWLVPHGSLIPWQPFSTPELARLKGSGNTVLVEFTADWCLTCKLNLVSAIETREVHEAIQSNKVVPLLADWTKGSQEIKDMLASLESKSIPLLAIFPADRPNEPIILRDLITKQQLLDAIKQAGPSKQSSSSELTASR